ncbi:MAG: type II toxin-antitoxin system RelE/ParE family toxin [Flavobacterium nitrogenifigens]|uniref:type II toxin-antitoxin system RelE/ParE family toxin n=1 Tax=Flavobacterium nitrogenifigens TaxID=1617283 RepID=UPI0028079100|nr:type II toxin-antitoxin system RelE/ParE family toxin [Flavobacterium nitrogenifigens]MDQ8015107.1 type II toxin-antitoxin system RelE/ParE family toxin [Flavobacterium nitrogenifigens]MDQ8054299.1 type II toxin-antitoxin system RelE/ParE family toxin [Pedobacter sp.]
MKEKFIRSIFYYKNYYLDFFEKFSPEVKKKTNWTLQLIATLGRVPEKYFKHITGSTGIYEIRVEVGSNIFRIFSFFDKGQLVILANGFQKKTQKTPKKEIELAEKLKKLYFDEKDK